MTRRSSQQQPLFPVQMFIPEPYPPGSVLDMLARYGSVLIRRSDFPQTDESLGGNRGWCPVQLSLLVVLQRHHGWTDRETVRRAGMDLQVKACLGLGLEQRGPSQPTLCRHRQRMQELGFDTRYMERMRELLEALELVGDTEPVVIDSVPIEGAGQQLDSYNVLAGAIRKGLSALARAQRRPVAEVAAELELGVYIHRSVKGHFEVQWDEEASRTAFVARLVADAQRIRQLLVSATAALATSQSGASSKRNEAGEDHTSEDTGGPGGPSDKDDQRTDDSDEAGEDHTSEDTDGPSATATHADTDGPSGKDNRKPPAMQQAIETIDEIIAHDIEFDEHEQVTGIRQQAAQDRRISVTDPDMRHGRKSARALIAGYKAQIAASLTHGFIVMVRVFGANRHDGQDVPQLVCELANHGIEPAWWGGDHAYGTLANHRYFDEHTSSELVARMARPTNGGRWTKDAFAYDFTAHTLTCPAGHQVAQSRWSTQAQRKGRLFVFAPEHCGTCPQRARCVSPSAAAGSGRTVFIVDEEERLIRAHLARRQEPAFRQRLAHRPVVERVIAGFAQCGGKQAHRFGIADVSFDATLSALSYNLRRLGSLLRRLPGLQDSLRRVLGAFLRALCCLLLRRLMPRCLRGGRSAPWRLRAA